MIIDISVLTLMQAQRENGKVMTIRKNETTLRIHSQQDPHEPLSSFLSMSPGRMTKNEMNSDLCHDILW